MYSTVKVENRLAWKTLQLFSSNLEIIWIYSGTLQLHNTRQSSKSSSFRLWKKNHLVFKVVKIFFYDFSTCRCGRPEKAWEAREDIRQSERSIFRRFGRAWKINQSYQCGGVQFFSSFYTFHRNSAVEGPSQGYFVKVYVKMCLISYQCKVYASLFSTLKWITVFSCCSIKNIYKCLWFGRGPFIHIPKHI